LIGVCGHVSEHGPAHDALEHSVSGPKALPAIGKVFWHPVMHACVAQLLTQSVKSKMSAAPRTALSCMQQLIC
jgi:hypothetical protein